MMNEQLNRIQDKINRLSAADSDCSLFGAISHAYRLNAPIPMKGIQLFEQAHRVRLPSEYVAFLTDIGNGGAGPFLGLEPLENSLFGDLDRKLPDSLLNPAKPFLHTEPWNMEFSPIVADDENEEEYYKQLQMFEESYFDREHMNGTIAICNFGCAVSLHLVVNGPEYGNIWTDDRGSDGGIYPSCELGNKGRITFLDWYELWLDNSLEEIKKNY